MSSEKVKIKKPLLEKLKSEMVRTDVGSLKFSKISKSRERYISPDYIENIIKGRTKTVDIREFDYVLAIYETLPDGNIKITKEMRDFVDTKLNEIGRISVAMIANHPLKSKTLSILRIEDFLKQKNEKLNRDEWDYIVERLNTIKPSPAFELSDEDLKIFTNLIARKKLSTIRLQKYIQAKHNKNFKVPYLQRLLDGQVTQMDAEDWKIIIQSLETIPSIKTGDTMKTDRTPLPKAGTIPLTSEMVQKLDRELDRTRTEYKIIINAAPEGLDLNTQKLSKIRRGTLKHIDQKIWHYLEAFFSGKPDARLPKS